MFFIVFNVFALVLIFVAYGTIIWHVLKSDRSIKQMGGVSASRGITFKTVQSVILLIGSSLLLWLPVIVVSIMSISSVTLPKTLYR